MSCRNLRKPILARGPVVALRYAWLRAPPSHRKNPTHTCSLRALTHKAPYEGGQSAACPPSSTPPATVSTLRFAHPTALTLTPRTRVVPAKAGTHNHREVLWREQAVAAEHITSPCGYGSRSRPGRRGESSDSNFKQRRGCESAFSRRVSPELCVSFHPLIESRAQGKPGAGCTRGSRAKKARG